MCFTINDPREIIVNDRKTRRLWMSALGMAAALTSLTLMTPAQAQATTQATTMMVFSCKYDANVRTTPFTNQDNIAYVCKKGTTIYPECFAHVGSTVNGSNLWYSLPNQHDGTNYWIHSSQVQTSGGGGLGFC
ncbi:hypothetical protein GCM10018953_50400 [Streptosporangium nondiastaticum]